MTRPVSIAAWLAIGVVTACASPPKESASSPVPEPAQSAAPPPPVESPPAPRTSSSAPAPAEDLPSLDAPPPKPAAQDFDFEVWCVDHKVDANLAVDGCQPAKLGNEPDDTLWCMRHEEKKSGVVLFYQGLYLPRGKKLAKTFEVLVGVGSLDLPSNPKKEIERYLVKLIASPAEDHKSVTFTDSAERGCDKALTANADKFSRDVRAGKPERDAIEKACRARGRYAWIRGGALRRTRR